LASFVVFTVATSSMQEKERKKNSDYRGSCNDLAFSVVVGGSVLNLIFVECSLWKDPVFSIRKPDLSGLECNS